MTPQQIKFVKVAQRQLKLDDPTYRTILRNIAGVESCKDLTNETLEDVMSFFESHGLPGHYWTDKARQRGSGNPRMAHKIAALWQSYEEAARESHLPPDRCYKLSGLVERISRRKTRNVAELNPREQWQLIEALKEIVERIKPVDALFPGVSEPRASASDQSFSAPESASSAESVESLAAADIPF